MFKQLMTPKQVTHLATCENHTMYTSFCIIDALVQNDIYMKDEQVFLNKKITHQKVSYHVCRLVYESVQNMDDVARDLLLKDTDYLQTIFEYINDSEEVFASALRDNDNPPSPQLKTKPKRVQILNSEDTIALGKMMME